jgi:hypothetical protein
MGINNGKVGIQNGLKFWEMMNLKCTSQGNIKVKKERFASIVCAHPRQPQLASARASEFMFNVTASHTLTAALKMFSLSRVPVTVGQTSKPCLGIADRIRTLIWLLEQERRRSSGLFQTLKNNPQMTKNTEDKGARSISDNYYEKMGKSYI